MNGKDIFTAAKIAADYTLKCIENTYGDKDHWYGVKFETAIDYLTKSLETKQTISRHQVRHCKCSSLLLKALSLTGRNSQFCRAMLRTIDNRGGSAVFTCLSCKKNHPVMVISESSGLKGFPRSLHVKLCPGLQDGLC